MTTTDPLGALVKQGHALSDVAQVFADHHTETAQILDRLTNGINTVVNICRQSQDVGDHYVSAARILAALRDATGGQP